MCVNLSLTIKASHGAFLFKSLELLLINMLSDAININGNEMEISGWAI